MRISKAQANTIKELANQTFGVGTSVYLFGSRARDAERGGDIDLYIQPNQSQALFRKNCA